MTYRLNPVIEKIESPVRILLIDTGQEKRYKSGSDACADVFDKQYNIRSISAKSDIVEIEMEVAESPDATFF